MADKNFRVKNGIETPLIASNTSQTAITILDNGDVSVYNDIKVPGDITGNDGVAAISMASGSGNVTVFGDLTVNGNDIKSSSGQVALSLSTNDVTVADRLFVAGNIIGSLGGYSTITMSTNDVTIAGDLTVSGNDIKSSTATALTMSGADVTVAGDLTVSGNDIKSSTATALTMSGANVTVAGNLVVTGGGITGPGNTADLIIDGASTIQMKNDYTLFSTDAGVTKAYFNNTGSKFTFNGGDADNTNNYNLYSHGTLGSLGNTTVGSTLFLKGATSGNVGLKAPAVAGSTTYTFPGADGTTGQFLKTDGSGTLSWATASSGSGGFATLNSFRDSTATTWSLAPGLIAPPTAAQVATQTTVSNGSVYYVPVSLTNSISISAFAFYVFTATGVSVAPSVQVFFNNVDNYWQPTTTALYLGEVTGITTTGQKSVTGLTKVLPAGNYLLGIQISSFTATSFAMGARSVLSAIPGTQVFLDSSLGSSYFWAIRGSVSYTSGTPTVAAYTADFGSTSTPGISNQVYLRWTKV